MGCVPVFLCWCGRLCSASVPHPCAHRRHSRAPVTPCSLLAGAAGLAIRAPARDGAAVGGHPCPGVSLGCAVPRAAPADGATRVRLCSCFQSSCYVTGGRGRQCPHPSPDRHAARSKTLCGPPAPQLRAVTQPQRTPVHTLLARRVPKNRTPGGAAAGGAQTRASSGPPHREGPSPPASPAGTSWF